MLKKSVQQNVKNNFKLWYLAIWALISTKKSFNLSKKMKKLSENFCRNIHTY